MSHSCDSCQGICRPPESNAVGVEIQEYWPERGWVSASKPYDTYCEAREALAKLASGKVPRRVYAALQERSDAL